jgi:pseudaminic acid biosynthesis-associated methylase
MNEQEAFWSGAFGDSYNLRNSPSIEVRMRFFERALAKAKDFPTAIEIGANKGANLIALRRVFEGIRLAGIEINEAAVNELRKIPDIWVIHGSALSYIPIVASHLSLSMGWLIHVGPEDLPKAYDLLHAASQRYILLAEYFASSPTPVFYRGHENRLWRRDFAGEMLDRFPDLKIVDYGFNWRRDPVTPLDDVSWFLMEKVLHVKQNQ